MWTFGWAFSYCGTSCLKPKSPQKLIFRVTGVLLSEAFLLSEPEPPQAVRAKAPTAATAPSRNQWERAFVITSLRGVHSMCGGPWKRFHEMAASEWDRAAQHVNRSSDHDEVTAP